MKFAFKEVPDSFGMFSSMVSENDVAYVGLFRVAFGYRVRAGFLDDLMGCELDWCAGADWDKIEKLYSMLISILEKRNEDASCFDGLPTITRIKPYFNDERFVKFIENLVGNYKNISVPKPPVQSQIF